MELPEVRPEDRTPLIDALLAIVRQLLDRVSELEQTNQQLRDEIARLRGYPESFLSFPRFSNRNAVTKHGRALWWGQATEHQMQRTDPNHGFARVRAPFVIAAVAPVSSVPGERSLYDPALGQHRKTFDSWFPCFHFEFPTRSIQRQPCTKIEIVILVVPPELLHTRVILGVESPHHVCSRGTIVEGCGRDHDRQQQSQRVHQNMTLSAVDFLAAIVAMLAASFRRLDRLAVNTR